EPHRRGARRAPGRPGGGGQALRRPPRAQGDRPDGAHRRGPRRHRAVRVGQVDPVPGDQPAGDDRRRVDHPRRPAPARGGPRPGAAARRRRHGLPVLQPLRPQDGAGERHPRADEGAGAEEGGRRPPRPRAARPGGRREPGRQVPRPALRRAAAARGHRAGAGDGPEGDALRRADLGPRPGDDQRGPRRDDRAGPRRDDDGRGHPRDGLRPPRRRPRGLHGRGRDRRAGPARAVLHRAGVVAGEGLPLQDPDAL
ncbi:MAG: ABC transporter, ATP-binding protein (cluster 3, basic aa/glutamine/opines), partial [uncultured Quadrisphaera sp.]